MFSKECKMQKGVFKIKLVFWLPVNSPALMVFMGFNCKPPLAEIIKIPEAKIKIISCLLIPFKSNVNL